MRKLLFILLLFGVGTTTYAQQDSVMDYRIKRDYMIGGIIWDGAPHLDQNALKLIAGIKEGDILTIPGDDITAVINKLWDSQLFSDIQIYAEKIIDNTIFLRIDLEGLPKLNAFKFAGDVSKSEADKLRELLGIYRGKPVNQNLIINSENIVRNYYKDKRYLNAEVVFVTKPSEDGGNLVDLVINVSKGEKIKIETITFHGNEAFEDKKLRRLMRDTKEKNLFNVFKSSKYLDPSYERDLDAVIAFYNSKGYRDARIVTDSVYEGEEHDLVIDIYIDEGEQYYFRNITWVGNTKYRSGQLDTLLGIEPGDVFNQALLDERLFMSPSGRDVTSLYMDDGHLFFQINPVEVMVDGDSIDYEMHIVEGKQARVNRIIITGNTKTSEHVIRREIRTKPGDLFRRSDIIRTQRELAQLGYFDPEGFTINPIPNPIDGTVDIEYGVVERPSDQIELSGGFGAGRVVGTLGVNFNNFALRKFFKGPWNPLPAGDGQQLSIRAQSTGLWYRSYNMSFTEPWLGGKKPNRFTVSLYNSRYTNGLKSSDPDQTSFDITGVSVGLGKRLQWPDDWFQFYGSINYQYYELNDYGSIFSFDNGYSNNASITLSLSRNSISDPLYPRWGSNITATLKTTLPWSQWFSSHKLHGISEEEAAQVSDQDKYKWIEYHKWKFTAEWYTPLSKDKKFVMMNRMGFGFLLPWNKAIGNSPFERFYLGGVPLGAFAFDGREIINLRGYEDFELSPQSGSIMIAKVGLELRYPLSLNPSATIYGLVFAEAGNVWDGFDEFNPFKLKRSTGFGLRLFLPMFGWLGLDYGFRIDPLETSFARPWEGKFHFTIGMNLGEL